MKPRSLISLAGLLILLNLVAPVQAQIVRNTAKIDPSTILVSLKFSDAGKDEDKIVLESLRINHPRIFKDFTRNYASASEIKLSKQSNFTIVWANVNGIKTRVTYDNKGRWQSTLKYYDAAHLSRDIRKMVLENNPCFKISGVVEVQLGNKTAHVVSIENSYEWKSIKVVNGEMEVYESFIKN